MKFLGKRGNVKVRNIKNESMAINRTMVNTDVFQALFPIYHISKACGLLPVRFTKEAHGRYQGRLQVFDVIYW